MIMIHNPVISILLYKYDSVKYSFFGSTVHDTTELPKLHVVYDAIVDPLYILYSSVESLVI